jgi:hypothetical protein
MASLEDAKASCPLVTVRRKNPGWPLACRGVATGPIRSTEPQQRERPGTRPSSQGSEAVRQPVVSGAGSVSKRFADPAELSGSEGQRVGAGPRQQLVPRTADVAAPSRRCRRRAGPVLRATPRPAPADTPPPSIGEVPVLLVRRGITIVRDRPRTALTPASRPTIYNPTHHITGTVISSWRQNDRFAFWTRHS